MADRFGSCVYPSCLGRTLSTPQPAPSSRSGIRPGSSLSPATRPCAYVRTPRTLAWDGGNTCCTGSCCAHCDHPLAPRGQQSDRSRRKSPGPVSAGHNNWYTRPDRRRRASWRERCDHSCCMGAAGLGGQRTLGSSTDRPRPGEQPSPGHTRRTLDLGRPCICTCHRPSHRPRRVSRSSSSPDRTTNTSPGGRGCSSWCISAAHPRRCGTASGGDRTARMTAWSVR